MLDCLSVSCDGAGLLSLCWNNQCVVCFSGCWLSLGWFVWTTKQPGMSGSSQSKISILRRCLSTPSESTATNVGESGITHQHWGKAVQAVHDVYKRSGRLEFWCKNVWWWLSIHYAIENKTKTAAQRQGACAQWWHQWCFTFLSFSKAFRVESTWLPGFRGGVCRRLLQQKK